MALRSAIYSLLIRKVSFAHYEHALVTFLPEGAHLLDVGVGNGVMLDRYAPVIRERSLRIDGLDVHEPYIRECRRRIEAHGLTDLVTCEQQDIVRYLERVEQTPPFVYFSASFMLLPDPRRTLELLRERLPADGRVLFAQTLMGRPSGLMAWLKPRLKYLTTIDFGRAQVRGEFLDLLAATGFELDTELRLEPVAGNGHFYFHSFRYAGAPVGAPA